MFQPCIIRVNITKIIEVSYYKNIKLMILKKLILFLTLIILSFQFYNGTGDYMPKREILFFEEIVHDASLYFISDVNEHARYIQ